MDFLERTRAPRTKEYTKIIKQYTKDYILWGKNNFEYKTPEGKRQIILSFLSFTALNADYYLRFRRDQQEKEFVKDFLACTFITSLDTSVSDFKKNVVFEWLSQMRDMFKLPPLTSSLTERYSSMYEKITDNDRKSAAKAKRFLGYRIWQNREDYEFIQPNLEHYNFLAMLLSDEKEYEHKNVKNFKEVIEFLKRKFTTSYDQNIEEEEKNPSTIAWSGQESYEEPSDENDDATSKENKTNQVFSFNDSELPDEDSSIHIRNYEVSCFQNQDQSFLYHECCEKLSLFNFDRLGDPLYTNLDQEPFQIDEIIDELEPFSKMEFERKF